MLVSTDKKWDYALGLIKVDGLEPSPEFEKLIVKEKSGEVTEEQLSFMEAEYTSIRLAELVTKESASHFNYDALCEVHRYIFQDVYEWAGQIGWFSGKSRLKEGRRNCKK